MLGSLCLWLDVSSLIFKALCLGPSPWSSCLGLNIWGPCVWGPLHGASVFGVLRLAPCVSSFVFAWFFWAFYLDPCALGFVFGSFPFGPSILGQCLRPLCLGLCALGFVFESLCLKVKRVLRACPWGLRVNVLWALRFGFVFGSVWGFVLESLCLGPCVYKLHVSRKAMMIKNRKLLGWNNS